MPWIDLRSRDLGGGGPGRISVWRGKLSPRTIYLPPIESDQVAQAVELRAWCAESAIMAVEHAIPGAAEPLQPLAGSRLFDLLGVLLDRDWGRLDAVPESASFSWPLIPGLTEDLDLIAEGLRQLSSRRALNVVPLVPELTAVARRHLSERHASDAFEKVFHSGQADPRAFASSCVEHDIDFLPRRALGSGVDPWRLAARIAAELGLIAELWIDGGGSELRAQSFYRTARWFETTCHDARSLWREGNLEVIPWVDAEIADVVGELAGGTERSTLLRSVARRWARHR